MQFLIQLAVALQACLLVNANPAPQPADLVARVSCDGGAGECVRYYSDADCNTALGSYRPTCEGNCFQFSTFSSVATWGSAFLGTGCEIYSDPNCENKILDMPSRIAPQCGNSGPAQSMRC